MSSILEKLKDKPKPQEQKKISIISLLQKKPDITGEVIKKNVIQDKLVKNEDLTEEKQTQPPKRFSPASILSELEKRNLGTKATRANILETLYSRGYVNEKSIKATPFGISLIETLEKYSPIIIDEKLTRSFEEEMESIVKAKEKDQTPSKLKPK